MCSPQEYRELVAPWIDTQRDKKISQFTSYWGASDMSTRQIAISKCNGAYLCRFCLSPGCQTCEMVVTHTDQWNACSNSCARHWFTGIPTNRHHYLGRPLRKKSTRDKTTSQQPPWQCHVAQYSSCGKRPLEARDRQEQRLHWAVSHRSEEPHV